MNTFFSADYIIPVTTPAIKNGVIEVDETGLITGIYPPGSPATANREIAKHRGIIVPGFVNAHCHLELSHMKDVIPKHTGLVPFLLQVMSSRGTYAEQAILDAMEAADAQMAANGIVAVGDHANNALSAAVKRRSSIHYHTFLETIGFEPELANDKFEASRAIARGFDGETLSLTAHAPYSVARELFVLLDNDRQPHFPLSIHNQESESENEFFRDKGGAFLDFYRILKKDLTHFTAQGKSSLQAYVPYLSSQTPLLLVHNTFTAVEDIQFATLGERPVTWCLCPKANLYIENALPEVEHFIANNQRIALGTDSLAANDRLCILSELKALQQYVPQLPFTETIKWATINGAEALQLSATFGSLERGKRPGVNLLTHTEGLMLTSQTSVQPLI